MEFVFMDNAFMVFLTVFLLVFALGLLIAGIFTVYFGSGKSRGIGAGLLVGGVLIGLLVVIACNNDIAIFEDVWLEKIFSEALVYLLGAVVGILAAIGLFLLAIMKS